MAIRDEDTRADSAAGRFECVQGLRAIAALLVVGSHSAVLWHEKFDPGVAPWLNGQAGVDLFFVISGFIMVMSSSRLAGRASGWRRFLALRLVRIVPLYWLATAAKLASVIAVPGLVLHTTPTAWNAVASFLFIPSRDGLGVIRPVLDVGWTLSFEMLFYGIFALALFSAVRPIMLVAPALVMLAALSLWRTDDWPAMAFLADPIMLEFIAGMLIAGAFARWRLARSVLWWAISAILAGLICLAALPASSPWERVSLWGTASAVTLLGTVFADRWISRYIPRLLVNIGEASYSLYLIHGFVLPVVGLAVASMGLHGAPLGVVPIVACMVASTLIALVMYEYFEKPTTTLLRARLDGH